jgi:putative hemolysin
MTAMIEADVAPSAPRAGRFVVSFAKDHAEVLETQRLRYRIFAQEMGAQIDGGDQGVDCDQYDPYCKHLLVRDVETGPSPTDSNLEPGPRPEPCPSPTDNNFEPGPRPERGRIVACTRILTDDQAPNAGGFYSSSEFDLQMIESLPGRVMEIGRTCVDAEFRNGAVIATLWQGIAAYITTQGFDYLFGCASIGLEDGGATAHAILQTIQARHMAPEYQRVRPYFPLPAADSRPSKKPKMPPLLKAYLSLGAKACGEAYWDRDFNCADVFMLLNVSELNPRYARHFLGRSLPADAQRTLLA